MNTQIAPKESPRDLTDAELDLTVGGWCFWVGPNVGYYCFTSSGCSPNMQPHCPGFR